MNKKTFKIILIFVSILLLIVFAFAKVKHISPLSWSIHNKVNQTLFSNKAINGYDPVAYFIEHNKQFQYKWNEATWYFATENNLNLFKVNPEKYVPQFGGYCAFAVSKGFTADTDPDAFIIIDNKLYLCSDKKFLDEWLQDESDGLQKAHDNWK